MMGARKPGSLSDLRFESALRYTPNGPGLRPIVWFRTTKVSSQGGYSLHLDPRPSRAAGVQVIKCDTVTSLKTATRCRARTPRSSKNLRVFLSVGKSTIYVLSEVVRPRGFPRQALPRGDPEASDNSYTLAAARNLGRLPQRKGRKTKRSTEAKAFRVSACAERKNSRLGFSIFGEVSPKFNTRSSKKKKGFHIHENHQA